MSERAEDASRRYDIRVVSYGKHGLYQILGISAAGRDFVRANFPGDAGTNGSDRILSPHGFGQDKMEKAERSGLIVRHYKQ